jgi:hypothetical protein
MIEVALRPDSHLNLYFYYNVDAVLDTLSEGHEKKEPGSAAGKPQNLAVRLLLVIHL